MSNFMNGLCRVLVALLLWAIPSALPGQYDKQKLVQCINSFGVKDYVELNDDQSKELTPLLPKLNRHHWGSYAKVVFKKSKCVSHALIVVEVMPMMEIPGASLAQVHFFKEDGTLIGSSLFNIGYRQRFHSIHVRKNPEIQDYLVEIQTSSYPVGSSVFKKESPLYGQSKMSIQVYAFENNEARLIRLTNEKGKPLSNPIYVKHFNYGPVCDYNLSQVEKLLQSTSITDQLHALVWLNGRHSRPCYSDHWYEHQSESLASIAAYKEAYSSRSLVKLLDEKIQHSNFWIRDQAKWVKDKLARPYNITDPNE